MTQPLHPAQPAPMGIPLDELIERAVKHARYETLAQVTKALEATIETRGGDPRNVEGEDLRDIVREVAYAYGLPAPAALKD